MNAIVTRNKDFDLPESLVDKTLEANKGYTSIAISTKGNEVQSVSSKFTEGKTKTELVTANKKFKHLDTAMYFAEKMPTLKEDKQPFVLLVNERDKPILVCFISGDFSNFVTKKDEEHTPEYVFCEYHIKPSVMTAHKFLKTIDKVWEHLDGDEFKTEIDDLLQKADEGTITFVSCVGDPPFVSFNASDDGEDFKWGFTSNTYGYLEEGADDKEGEEEQGLLAGLGENTEEVPSGTPDTEDPAKITEKETETKELPAGYTIEDSVLYYKFPGPRNAHNKEVRMAYITHANFKPDNYKSYPKIKVLRPDEAAKALGFTLSQALKNATKDTETKHIPTASGPTSAIPPKADTKDVSKVPGFIPTDMKHRIAGYLSKSKTGQAALDQAGKPISDPTKIQSMEIKAMPASIAIGLKNIEETMYFSEEDWEAMAIEPEAAKSFLMEMSNWMRQCYLVVAAAKMKSVQVPDKDKERRRM